MVQRKPRYRNARLKAGCHKTLFRCRFKAPPTIPTNKPDPQFLFIVAHHMVSTYLVDTSCIIVLKSKRCGEIRACRQGYRRRDAQNPRRVFISGQKRGVFGIIKRELRRCSAIEPIIGHLKTEGYPGRCYLKGRAGDSDNVILSAVGHNFRRVLAWLRLLCCLILTTLADITSQPPQLKSDC